MKHSPEVQRIHWGTDVTAIRVEGLKPGPGENTTVSCDLDDEDATTFRVVAQTGKQSSAWLVIAEYKIEAWARERWVARLMALACAAEMSNKFKIPVSDI